MNYQQMREISEMRKLKIKTISKSNRIRNKLLITLFLPCEDKF